MAYNLLLDTEFENNTWNFINCRFEEGCLISKGKVFGVEQEIILADITKLYFRFEYELESGLVGKVMLGIQYKDVLNITKKTPKENKHQIISLVEDPKQKRSRNKNGFFSE